jgi:hypothetical protein
MESERKTIESMRQEIQLFAQLATLTDQRLQQATQAGEQWARTNTLLMAELHVLRAFCSALAQTLPIDRGKTLAAFSIFCAALRPDETVNKPGADAFDRISQMIAHALQAPPEPMPAVPPTPPSRS